MFDVLANPMSPNTWIIILVIVLVLFGGNKIPEIMKGLGSGMKEFKKGMREDDAADAKPAEKSAPAEKKTEN
jgi:sec-independent protein translocase protein TatA